MLINLHIENFLIIEKTTIDFTEGLNVITGETGAGKSMIFDAIGLILGDKGGKDLIRNGADKSFLQASFMSEESAVSDLLQSEGFELEDLLIISRDLYHSGKSIFKVNGRVVNSTFVRQLGQVLINLSGQHEHQLLLESAAHRRMIDQYGDTEIYPLTKMIKDLYHSYRALQLELESFTLTQSQWLQRTDFLAFQIEEIEQSKLKEGEEEALDESFERLKHFETVQNAVQSVIGMTRDDRGILSNLNKAKKLLGEAVTYDKRLESALNQLDSAFYTVESASEELRDLIEATAYDESELEAIELRLSHINDLKRKYGKTITDILSQLEAYQNEYAQLMDYESNKQKINDAILSCETEYSALADQLSTLRQAFALKFESDMMLHLADLNFNQCQFKAVFSKEDGIFEEGTDRVEFYLSTNPGEPMRPLRKIASGGELSRIMLAAKLVNHKDDFPPTQIFDEIDSGISGRTANAVASKLRTIALDGQVILVTHLPQIAVAGNHHLLIEKQVVAGTTKVIIKPLPMDERVSEIARMIGSGDITELTLLSAKEMLLSTQSN